MREALSWYRILVAGGFVGVCRCTGYLGYELRCIIAGRNKERIFPYTRPAVALLVLIAVDCFVVVQYILTITLVLPLLMFVAHLTGKIVSMSAASRHERDARMRAEAAVVGRNWHYYDGILYETAIDPTLAELWRKAASCVSADDRVIDICCGTGGLTLLLAEKCGGVTGIDHSRGMIDYARNSQQKRGLKNVTFTHADARSLRDFKDGEFDCAILSMALHEMPRAFRVPVLKEAARVAVETMVVDYIVPLPSRTQGVLCGYLEFVAGLSHFKSFLDYSRHQGLDALLEDAHLTVTSDIEAMDGCMRIVKAVSERTGG
jgi:SAM-dependent methyltransferase